MLLESCICGDTSYSGAEMHFVKVAICNTCGIHRQALNMTKEELHEFYSEQYHQGIYSHSVKHDRGVAKERLDSYAEKVTGRVLDVGSGNGAFVQEARARGIECYGVDIQKREHNGIPNRSVGETGYTYYGETESIGFPTDFFSTLTIHDVLEHVIEPVELLKECFRIIEENGTIFLDFPSFFSEDGEHHWKSIEHLWMLNFDDITRILQETGFENISVENPIPGKFLFTATKPKQTRTKILVPAGIGDTYWVLTKLKSFCEVEGIKGEPEVMIHSVKAAKNRSFDFVQKFNFVKAGGYVSTPNNRFPEFQEGYLKDGKNVFRDVWGCDYFISYNGSLRFNKKLEDISPQYKVDWYPKIFRSLEQVKAGEVFRLDHWPYIVAYFVPHGMYQGWLAQFNKEQIYLSLKEICEKTGSGIIFVGAKWDMNGLSTQLIDRAEQDGIKNQFVDLTGRTSLTELLALIENSDAVYGFPSGATFLGPYYKKPTVLLWNDYFSEGFHENCCPPDSLNNWYKPLQTYKHDRHVVVKTMLEMLGV